ncbi:MAG: hypothetical protein ABIP94_06430 [Planctomycetota bacterium]
MTALDALAGTSWTGENELWLDPLGNTALKSPATLKIEKGKITYTWSHEGTVHSGTITVGDVVHWHDTFHMAKGTDCKPIAGAWGLMQLWLTWSMGNSPEWGWRIGLFQRSANALVLQMTVVMPSGEEGRAVRMALTKTP